MPCHFTNRHYLFARKLIFELPKITHPIHTNIGKGKGSRPGTAPVTRDKPKPNTSGGARGTAGTAGTASPQSSIVRQPLDSPKLIQLAISRARACPNTPWNVNARHLNPETETTETTETGSMGSNNISADDSRDCRLRNV